MIETLYVGMRKKYCHKSHSGSSALYSSERGHVFIYNDYKTNISYMYLMHTCTCTWTCTRRNEATFSLTATTKITHHTCTCCTCTSFSKMYKQCNCFSYIWSAFLFTWGRCVSCPSPTWRRRAGGDCGRPAAGSRPESPSIRNDWRCRTKVAVKTQMRLTLAVTLVRVNAGSRDEGRAFANIRYRKLNAR